MLSLNMELHVEPVLLGLTWVFHVRLDVLGHAGICSAMLLRAWDMRGCVRLCWDMLATKMCYGMLKNVRSRDTLGYARASWVMLRLC